MTNGDMSLLPPSEDEIKYRGMFENAIEGIYQSTPDGHYLVVNAALARMYGYETPEDLMNEVRDIEHQIYVDSSFRERFRKEIDQTGFVKGMEYQVRRLDGEVIWISESARVVRDANGNIHHYEGFIDNITDRKAAEAERAKLEQQMLHAQKMDAIGTLAGGIAHDFNNILCAILGYTELALVSPEIKGLNRGNLEMVLKSANRARELIKRILTFSRPIDAQHRPLKLGTMVEEGVKLLQATLPSSIGIQVKIRTNEDVVVADATEMHQIIMNLGTNAGHAMKPKAGLLEFELESLELDPVSAQLFAIPAGAYVHLIVRDSGRGMSPEVLERIFEPFFSTKAPGQGTGLGLTLVHKIVTRSGGYIKVNSREGNGTTFHVYLPQSRETPAPVSVDKTQLMKGHREQILVVDDEIPILDMMQQHLRKMGYRVMTRADSVEAMKTFRADSGKFDLIITDHTMPGLQGAELAEEVGAIRPDLPVILMTGLNQPPDLSGSRHAPLRSVFRKPIDFVELSQRMRQVLDQSGKLHSTRGEGLSREKPGTVGFEEARVLP
jgi:PAS domain S-box-containing protein